MSNNQDGNKSFPDSTNKSGEQVSTDAESLTAKTPTDLESDDNLDKAVAEETNESTEDSNNKVTKTKQKKINLGLFISYIATIVVILLIALWISLSRNIFDEESLKNIYVILCDAFTVPGIIATGLGLLITISGTGFFTAMKFIGLSVLGAFIPGLKLRQKKYKDFKEQEDKKRKTFKTDFMLICGLSSVAIAVVFLVLYQTI